MTSYERFRANVLAVIDPRLDEGELCSLVEGMDVEMLADVLVAVARFVGASLEGVAQLEQADIGSLIARIGDGMDREWAREQ